MGAERHIDLIVQDLRDLGEELTRTLEKNIEKATGLLAKTVERNISLTCHSLAKLREMGHPYAVRDPHNPHNPPYLVHKQEGNLIASLYSESVETTGIVGVDEGSAPYARFIITGTSKMIPRDFLGGSLFEKRDQIYEVLKKNLRQCIIAKRIT